MNMFILVHPYHSEYNWNLLYQYDMKKEDLIESLHFHFSG